MPLKSSGWERFKGGYKLLNYMSVGLPVVASPVGINNKLVKDGFNGFLASNNEEWINKLSLLISDFELRKKIGIQGWETAKNYTAKEQFPRIMRIFETVIKN